MENQTRPERKAAGFHGLGIEPQLLAVLGTLKFEVPTPVQQAAIPPGLEGRDILGIAQTGTGKTLAFGTVLVQALRQTAGRALVLVPTRELALQVDEAMRKLGNPFDIRSVVVAGGMDIEMQAKLLLKEKIRIVIATPGRLLDLLERKDFDPSPVRWVVLDEADRMLDMGFAPQIERIAKDLPAARQTLLFSATMPAGVMRIAALYVKNPLRVEVSRSGAAPEKIDQGLCVTEEQGKFRLLVKILSKTKGSTLVFVRSKADAAGLRKALEREGHAAGELHSGRDQGQRRYALKSFKSGVYRVLVCTDIAARGIDVSGIELVVNYDLPHDPENYVHRIGRTGRAGLAGRAVTFATPDEEPKIRAIEKLTKTPFRRS